MSSGAFRRQPGRRWHPTRFTRAMLALALAAGTSAGSCLAAPGVASAASTLPAWPANPNWQSYVEGNGASALTPASVSATGSVTNAQALVTGSGVTTLTYVSGHTAPVVVLDYGKEVGGLPYFQVSSVTPASGSSSVTMRAAYSEVSKYLLGASPGTVAGDANGNNGVGTDRGRADSFTLTPASGGTRVGNAVTAVQGGERYEAITLTAPGTVVLSGAGITAKFNNLGSGSYKGYFISSDTTANEIWYDGVYTAQTDAIPAGDACSSTTACSKTPVILDGAKRDRRPWSGDLSVEGRTLFDSLGFGAGGSDYIKDSIAAFGASPQSNGSVCGQISNWVASPPSCSFYSPSYSMYYVLNLAEYYLYSGDTSFAESQYQVMKKELAYNQASVSATSGLSTAAGSDWDFYDGSKGGSTAQGGAATATNMLNYEALADGAWLAGQLAARDPGNSSAATWKSDATTWTSEAAALKSAINAKLLNTSLGTYQLSSSANGSHPATAVPQDANAESIVFGVAPPSDVTGILAYLKSHLWGTYGPQPYSANAGYSTVISPFVTGYELDARFASGDTSDALALADLMWGQMVNTSGQFYTGTLWEKLGQNGQITDSNASLAHGWATAPVSAFSSYLLGVQPASPGYQTWQVVPQPGSLLWAEGQVPTPSGAITVDWAQTASSGQFNMQVTAPAGTSGQVWVPLASAASVSSALTAGATFLQRSGNYDVYQVGSGTFQFSSGSASS